MRPSVTGDHKGDKAPLYPSQPPSPLQSYPSLGYKGDPRIPATPSNHPRLYNDQQRTHNGIIVRAGVERGDRGTLGSSSKSGSPNSVSRLQQFQSGSTLAPSEGWLAMVL